MRNHILISPSIRGIDILFEGLKACFYQSVCVWPKVYIMVNMIGLKKRGEKRGFFLINNIIVNRGEL